VELVFLDATFHVRRAGWGNPQQPHEADVLAKKLGKFLNVPVETYMPFYASFSLSKGFYLTEEQAKDAEKAGIKVDPKAIK
jgi:hypothetical protein